MIGQIVFSAVTYNVWKYTMASCNRLAFVVLPWRQRFSFHLSINVPMSLVKRF